MLIWTVLCAVITVAWMQSDVSGASELPTGKVVKVDKEFNVTLVSTNPTQIKLDNLTTSDAYFDYSDITMKDNTGAEHEPEFALGQLGDTVPASGSVTRQLTFGNIGGATAESFHWECDACDAGETIGRAIVFILMGGIYWFGMLILFIVWLVSRPPRIVMMQAPATPSA